MFCIAVVPLQERCRGFNHGFFLTLLLVQLVKLSRFEKHQTSTEFLVLYERFSCKTIRVYLSTRIFMGGKRKKSEDA